MIYVASSLRLEVIRDWNQLEELKSVWTALANSQPYATPFQTPDWLITWWKHFGSGELRVFLFQNSSQLAGIIPCFLHEWQGRRQLTLLGSGISDYLEPLIAAEHRAEILEMLSSSLREMPDWDVCHWQDLSSPTACAGLGTTQEDTLCSEISTSGRWDDFYNERPHGLRRNLRRYREKARAISDINFFVRADFDPALLEILIALHSARWNRQGEAGMIAANQSAGFLRDLAPKFASAGMLHLFGLEFQQRMAAVILSFPYRNVLFSYLSAFDPKYQQYGFGKLLLQKSLEYAFLNKYCSWNFLRGDEPYKFDWGARPIAKSRLVLWRSAL